MSDPYIWLEDVEGDKALEWVRQRNEATQADLASDPGFESLEQALADIYDSDAKIPMAARRGEWYYNFWRDADHPRGIWRRTKLEEYRKDAPVWETVLDLDELNRVEDENWVWHGVEFLRPDQSRCLVALSRGGADADVTREFDVETKSFVGGGFFRPEAKGRLTWIDEDTVFVVTDTGEGSTNKAGYARLVRRWTRGTSMLEAPVVFEGPEDNVGYGIYAMRDRTPGFERELVLHYLDNRDSVLHVADADGGFQPIDAPASAEKHLHRQWLLLGLRDDWTLEGQTYPAGSLLTAELDAWVAGDRSVEALFEPTPTTALEDFSCTRGHIVLTVLDDVASRVFVATRGEDGWARRPLAGLPEFGSVHTAAVDDENSDELWVVATDYLTPSTLMLADASRPDEAPEVLKSEPAFFDSSTHTSEQRFTTSADGTRVPYFIVRPHDLVADGSNPTLLYGYGGFEISMTPGYVAGVGKGWLEAGGTFVVANIRGGGEYGPRWHQAALKENRHRAYEDFAAVARDLVETGVTTRQRLGIRGGSNGGLLTGNMLTQYPELFGAVVIQVPLLDMQRYHLLLAGASWMGEYGNPDEPAEWEFISKFSPYHLLDAERDYPPTLLLTSTRDDRVHPGHARKFMARLEEMGKQAAYYENIEGGHGGAADNRQRAHMDALYLTFLRRALMP